MVVSGKALPCGIVVAVIGRCCGMLCPHATAFSVTLRSVLPGGKYTSRGYCGSCIDELFLSPEDYEKCIGTWASNKAPGVFNRALYDIRPLTEVEAAEVAHEQSAPTRWEAEGRMGVYRRIVAFGVSEKVDGMWVEPDVAQCVVDVYDGFRPAMKRQFAGRRVEQQCHEAQRLALIEAGDLSGTR